MSFSARSERAGLADRHQSSRASRLAFVRDLDPPSNR